jgi:His-Xaa-Ser system radical SAM maturase HxsB
MVSETSAETLPDRSNPLVRDADLSIYTDSALNRAITAYTEFCSVEVLEAKSKTLTIKVLLRQEHNDKSILFEFWNYFLAASLYDRKTGDFNEHCMNSEDKIDNNICKHKSGSPYELMPFRFERLEPGIVLLTNYSGQFYVMTADNFKDFVEHTLSDDTSQYLDLLAKGFLRDSEEKIYGKIIASKYRTKYSHVNGSTKLHMVVPTIRCNQSCVYCQVTRATADAATGDMTDQIADSTIRLILSSPAPHITLEFQGGEPLLRFDLIERIIEGISNGAAKYGKSMNFVVCSNLTLLRDDHLEYFRQKNVSISTSLDGPAALHDRNRLRHGGAAHAVVVRNIRRCQEALGEDRVSALMTTTRHSLAYGHEIVDEYLRLGLHGIFLRRLNPYGFATRNRKEISYSPEEFIKFYKETLAYIIDINRKGRRFMENMATIMLKKILTPFSPGFVDLRSPTGSGFGAALYNYDGSVYPSDEARMLAEMGDPIFRLGHVLGDSYDTIFLGNAMRALAEAGCNEALAGCSECVYQPYCGADPVGNYRLQGDSYGHRPTSSNCEIYKKLFWQMFSLIRNADQEIDRIIWAWLTDDSLTNKAWPEFSWHG